MFEVGLRQEPIRYRPDCVQTVPKLIGFDVAKLEFRRLMTATGRARSSSTRSVWR